MHCYSSSSWEKYLFRKVYSAKHKNFPCTCIEKLRSGEPDDFFRVCVEDARLRQVICFERECVASLVIGDIVESLPFKFSLSERRISGEVLVLFNLFILLVLFNLFINGAGEPSSISDNSLPGGDIGGGGLEINFRECKPGGLGGSFGRDRVLTNKTFVFHWFFCFVFSWALFCAEISPLLIYHFFSYSTIKRTEMILKKIFKRQAFGQKHILLLSPNFETEW